MLVIVSKLHNGRIQVAVAKPQHNSKPVQSYVSEKEVREILLALGVAPQQPRGSKRMLAVCRAGSKVTEVLSTVCEFGPSARHDEIRPIYAQNRSSRN